ncbi:IS110 family transposase [archaeon]|nr:MAG: IS110 family transposase [archaeon]
MESGKTYIGIDVSKLSFDVSIEDGSNFIHFQLSNNVEGFKRLLELLGGKSNLHVVMEASGAYYLCLASYLYEHQIGVSVVNPLVIRRFCQMRLCRAKTDKKDAKMIALYGKTEQPELWHPDPGYVLELRQMLATVDGLNKSRTASIRQIEAFSHSSVISKDAIKALSKMILILEKEIASLEGKMEQLVQSYHRDLFTHIRSVPGLGKKTAMMLIVLTGAFTKFSNAKQLSSYFGLSPRIFESGTSVKGRARITKMGMSKIRAMLYICAWSAKRCNAACKELYDRLTAKGKSKRLALIAVANKLLKQAFAIATKKEYYLPS